MLDICIVYFLSPGILSKIDLHRPFFLVHTASRPFGLQPTRLPQRLGGMDAIETSRRMFGLIDSILIVRRDLPINFIISIVFARWAWMKSLNCFMKLEGSRISS